MVHGGPKDALIVRSKGQKMGYTYHWDGRAEWICVLSLDCDALPYYLCIITDRINAAGNAIDAVRPSVCFYSVFGTD